jgi:hypothetical protein
MAANSAYFKVKSIGLSKINGRKPCSLINAARHNLREIQSELGAFGHIDPNKTKCNLVLDGPSIAQRVVDRATEVSNSAGIDLKKKRQDYCQAIELVFSLPINFPIYFLQYFQSCLSWVKRAYQLPVLSAVVHLDEGSPHLHVLLLPLNTEGKYVGGEPIRIQETKKNRESFFENVAGPAGLKRQDAMLKGMHKQVAINLIIAKCCELHLPEANGRMWRVLETAISRDPVPSLEALGIEREELNNAIKQHRSRVANIQNYKKNPIGIENSHEKFRSLSCVGIQLQTIQPKSSTTSMSAKKVRFEEAKNAQVIAIKKHSLLSAEPMKPTSDFSGIIRTKDEFVHDLSPWED